MIEDKIKGKRHGYLAICICDYCGKRYEKSYAQSYRKDNHFCCISCKNNWQKGSRDYKPSSETKNKMSETHIKVAKHGSEHHSWNGGKYICGGYYMIFKPEHPYCNGKGYVYEHRAVMEEKLNRILTPKETIHHINENKLDNRIENLVLFATDSEHRKYHMTNLFNAKIKDLETENKSLKDKLDNAYGVRDEALANQVKLKKLLNKDRITNILKVRFTVLGNNIFEVFETIAKEITGDSQ